MRFCFESRSFNEGGQSPDKWTSVWCHDEIVSVKSKKQGTSAPAIAEGGVGRQRQ
jgi:hypothetical protein